MKYLLTIACSLVFFQMGNATIHTVCNLPNCGAQYTSIQAAVDAASSGDIIYVQGSSTSYGSVTITNKSLQLIGAGYAPNKQSMQPSTVPTITFISNIAGSVDGSEVQGFVCTNILFQNNIPSSTISGLLISNNKINNLSLSGLYTNSNFSNIIIQNNYITNQFTGSGINIYSNVLVQNNVIYATNSGIYSFYNTSSFLFDHNLVYNGPEAFVGSRYILATNNIFVERTSTLTTSWGEFITFTNNITYNCGQNSPWTINNNIDGGGNISNQNPQMVDQVAVDGGTNNPLLDFSVPSGPANNAGTDGLDLGVRFDATGALNWAKSRTSLLPYIYSSVLNNPTIPAGGTLEINITAKSNY